MTWIEKCLVSLFTSSHAVHVVVVDNGSTDGTVAFIREYHPLLECIETGRNLGFGQANNIGLKIAVRRNADYVFLLNQDAWIEKDTLSCLIRVQEENPEYGILSPLHLKRDNEHFEEHFLGYLKKSDTASMFENYLIKNTRYPDLIPTSFVNAACWLISSSCLLNTGGFDPIFFHYGEDDHYAQRAHYHGFKMGIATVSRIIHDRDNQSGNQPKNLNNGVNKEWIYFLTQVCDINKPGYQWTMFKRGVRHFLLFFPSLLNPDKYERTLHFIMCRNIFSSFQKVGKSRMLCSMSGIPFLG